MARPNLLLVFSDQHRWCDLGCYGNEEVITPNFDAFAAEAVRFTHCFSNAPLCVPARGSLLTGLMALKHGAITNDLPIRRDVLSIAHILNDAGYRTGYIGKWHLAGVPRDKPIPVEERLGFQEWKVNECNHNYLRAHYYDEANRRVDIGGYEPAVQTDLAIDFIRRHVGCPWALVLSWGPPHDPYHEVPDRYLALYRRRKITLRPNVPDRILATLTRTLSREDIVECYRGYCAHITALDEQFGRLLAALEETRQVEQTIVVYTSDHGDMLGSQGYMNKQLPYDEAVRIPLLVRWSGRTYGGVCNELIGLVDLPVSLLGLMGLSFPHPVNGQDLHQLFVDPQAQGLEAVYLYDLVPCHQAAERDGTEWRGLRTRRYTFARSASDDGFVLFDNESDPYQLRNLVHEPEYQELKAGLLRQLDAFIARYDALLPWQDLIRRFGFKNAWNRSQAYFGLPLLD